mmetsp:Transcript_12306/g.20520  ORF Transcript_12306/g.20520 Transcript_12306/m.20520 type:complete len:323 (+) Transcript_12306:46-1014(+)
MDMEYGGDRTKHPPLSPIQRGRKIKPIGSGTSELVDSSASLMTQVLKEQELKFPKYQKPMKPTDRPPFSSTADRFENHASLKQDATVRHKLATQDLGPGTHEVKGLYQHQLDAPSVMGSVLGGSLPREGRSMELKDLKTATSIPPGAYEVSSLFKSRAQLKTLAGSQYGSSSFLSKGRDIDLMPDAQFYASNMPDKRTDHMGPGYYQTPMAVKGQLPPTKTTFPGYAPTHYNVHQKVHRMPKLDLAPPQGMFESKDSLLRSLAALPTEPRPDGSVSPRALPLGGGRQLPTVGSSSAFINRNVNQVVEDIQAVRDLPMDMFYS